VFYIMTWRGSCCPRKIITRNQKRHKDWTQSKYSFRDVEPHEGEHQSTQQPNEGHCQQPAQHSKFSPRKTGTPPHKPFLKKKWDKHGKSLRACYRCAPSLRVNEQAPQQERRATAVINPKQPETPIDTKMVRHRLIYTRQRIPYSRKNMQRRTPI